MGDEFRVVEVRCAEAVVVKSDTVHYTHQQERPMTPSLGGSDVSTIIHGKEDVGRLFEIGEGGLQGEGIFGILQHKRHAGSEEHDVGFRVFGQLFSLEIFFPEADDVVGEPVVVFDRVDVFARQAHVVVAEVCFFGRELDWKKKGVNIYCVFS